MKLIPVQKPEAMCCINIDSIVAKKNKLLITRFNIGAAASLGEGEIEICRSLEQGGLEFLNLVLRAADMRW